jgi:hypothetical protein
MSYPLTTQEFQAALQLNADYRHAHFVSKVAQSGLIWLLKNNEGLLFLSSDSDELCLPLWPHEEYAKLWLEQFPGYELQSLPIHIWFEHWVPALEEQGISIAVFPMPDQENSIMNITELAQSIQEKQNI